MKKRQLGVLSMLCMSVACGGNAVPSSSPATPSEAPAASASTVASVAAPASAPATPATLAAKRDDVRGMMLDAGWLYWVTSHGVVERIRPGHGTPEKVADFASERERGLGVDRGKVYGYVDVANGGTILRVDADRSGGKLEPVAATPTHYYAFMAVDDAHLVWGFIDRGGQLVIQVLDNGKTEPRTLATLPMNAPNTHGVLTANDFYFCNGGSVYRVALASGNVTAVLTLADRRVTDFAIASERIYATAWDGGTASDGAVHAGFVVAAPLAGGTPTVLFSEGPRNVYGVVADATSIYWIDRPQSDKGGAPPDARIFKMPIGGGPPTSIVDHVQRPGNLALSATSLFYTSDDTAADTSDVVWVKK